MSTCFFTATTEMCQNILEILNLKHKEIYHILGIPLLDLDMLFFNSSLPLLTMCIVRVTRKLLGAEQDDNIPIIFIFFTHSFLFPSMLTSYVIHNLNCRLWGQCIRFLVFVKWLSPVGAIHRSRISSNSPSVMLVNIK